MGPGGLKPDEIKYWEARFRKVVKNKAWKDLANKRYYRTHFMGHDETVKLFNSELVQIKARLKKLGMLK